MRLHGKRHKSDSYYFRWHYGKQRRVCITKEYVDRPTEKQVSAREAFTALRREVARQLKDADLKAAWEARFKKDNEGYKMLHTYVYAMMKRGESVTKSTTCRDALLCVSTDGTQVHSQRPCERCSPKGDAQKGVSTDGTQLHQQRPCERCSPKGDAQKGVSTGIVTERRYAMTSLLVWNGVIVPLFLPSKVPKKEKAALSLAN